MVDRIIAYVFLLSILFVIIGYINLDWPTKARYKAKAAYKTYWDRNSRPPGNTSFYANDGERDSHEHEHREQEKEFWIASKFLTLIATVAAVIAAFFAGFAMYYTEEQARIAQSSERPIIGTPLIEVNKGVIYWIFTNTGKVPTRGFLVGADIVNGDTRILIREAMKHCRDASAGGFVGDNALFSVVPGNRWTIMNRYMSKKDVIISSGINMLAGCAIYRTPELYVKRTGFFGSFQMQDGKIERQDWFAVDAT